MTQAEMRVAKGVPASVIWGLAEPRSTDFGQVGLHIIRVPFDASPKFDAKRQIQISSFE
ncbi:MAG TPA: hypothetical protein VGG11_13035 [Xanthobacteraceae bacterium]|jgi:hypothetical protein